jgi:protein involved in polysaccharide export with SLBB domain
MKTIRSLSSILAFVVVTFSLAAGQAEIASGGTQPATGAVLSTAKTFQERYPRYKLEPGDAFDVSFELNPEFNQSVVVQPDGFITLRGASDIQVAGQTIPELTNTLRNVYDKSLFHRRRAGRTAWKVRFAGRNQPDAGNRNRGWIYRQLETLPGSALP